MPQQVPITKLDPQYSSPSATATPWATAAVQLEKAEIFWLSTVRPDRRPHVTPLPAIWMDGGLYFCTGAEERKAKNLAQNAHCILTTGRNTLNEEGLDLVVEGDAVRVLDNAELQCVADLFEAKYGSDWHYDVHDGTFVGNEENVALVFKVVPTTAFGFGKGAVFSQTRWRFS
jgi:nitroimidazol reductase NimA-like FMN-containing flavoprotein (pyridoxamine 5'-phosphate oxidase superfamily)